MVFLILKYEFKIWFMKLVFVCKNSKCHIKQLDIFNI